MRRVLVVSLDVFGKFADSILCRGKNFIEWADKGLGGLEKNTRYFKGERKKEDKKEVYS